VVYCAHDREFSAEVLSDFEKQTGLKVIPKFDTEATKSVGLFQDLLSEAGKPRCDVFWNNEIINTVRLQKKGLLQPYASPAAAPYPAQYKAADDTWHAFAARARIILVNTDRVPSADRPKSLLDLTGPRWRGKVAIAKPQFGTTATEAACLFQVWGADKARQFYRDLSSNDVNIVAGNKQVAEGVGAGLYDAGLTDTDDALGEVRAGKPVALIFPDAAAPESSDRGTLFIPNTVALIRGCPNPEG
jgi:iron(III) transport system substrate-binding protein